MSAEDLTTLDYARALRESLAACDRFDNLPEPARISAYEDLAEALYDVSRAVGRVRAAVGDRDGLKDVRRFTSLTLWLICRADRIDPREALPEPGDHAPILSVLSMDPRVVAAWHAAEPAFRHLSSALGYAPIHTHGFAQCLPARQQEA